MIFRPVDDALHILNEPSSWHHMIALSLWSYLLDDEHTAFSGLFSAPKSCKKCILKRFVTVKMLLFLCFTMMAATVLV